MTTTTTHTASEVMARESAHVLQTYRRAPVVFERGEGCRLFSISFRASAYRHSATRIHAS
jgi:acetylornithine/succinyldiaminopimelate/putrescine aminotransferase